MKIAAMDAQLPSRIVGNDEIIEIIRKKSEKTYTGNLESALRRIKLLLRYAGSQHRHWLAKDETPLQLIQTAFNNALEKAAWEKDEIELIIYVGIGRAVIEPGNSYILAQALNLQKVECFDIMDACMSWIRAMQIAQNYLKTNTYKKIAIINAEFNMLPELGGGWCKFSLENEEQIEWTFPTYTIGEATTVTLLTADDTNNFEFNFLSFPELADLCTIPCKGYEGFIQPSQKNHIGKNGLYHFTSYGAKLHAQGDKVIAAFNKTKTPLSTVDLIFTHASSEKLWQKGVEKFSSKHKLYSIFPQTGNLGSASVPTAMNKAITEGKLKRGDTVLNIVGSAGMSFASVNYIY